MSEHTAERSVTMECGHSTIRGVPCRGFARYLCTGCGKAACGTHVDRTPRRLRCRTCGAALVPVGERRRWAGLERRMADRRRDEHPISQERRRGQRRR